MGFDFGSCSHRHCTSPLSMVLREDVTTTICYHQNQEAVISIKPIKPKFSTTVPRFPLTKKHTVIPSCCTSKKWLRNRSMLFPGRVAQIDFSLVACRANQPLWIGFSYEWWKGKMRLLSFVVCYTTSFHQEFIMKLIEVSIHRPVNMCINIYIYTVYTYFHTVYECKCFLLA